KRSRARLQNLINQSRRFSPDTQLFPPSASALLSPCRTGALGRSACRRSSVDQKGYSASELQSTGSAKGRGDSCDGIRKTFLLSTYRAAGQKPSRTVIQRRLMADGRRNFP